MAPLLTLQIEFFNHWYKSCDSTRETYNNLVDTSHDFITHYTRQQQTNIDKFLGTLTSKKSSSKKKLKAITGTAVITGGIGGIGTAICKKLAADGNRIIATYIPFEMENAVKWNRDMKKLGFDTDILECDVSDFESCKKLATHIEERYGAIDVLVNAAGITRDALLKKMGPDKWHAVIDTNLDSVFNVTRNFIDGMLKKGYGRIINIASVNGQKGQFGQTNYSTAKAGMIGFSRSLALELADKGITVNCVCPGYVGTSMVESIRKDVLDGIIGQIPAGRLASTDEIAHAVSFLADKNSSYITGTEIAVNGGLWLG